MYDIQLKQIESICEEEGHYIARLKKQIANQEKYLDDIHLINIIKSEFRIPDRIVEFLTKQGCKLFFEFSPKEGKDLISFFNTVYRLEKGEDILSPKFSKHRSMLFDVYKNLLDHESEAEVVFEMSYIHKASNYIKEVLQNESADKLTKEIIFMKKIINFISDIRKELSNNFSISSSFYRQFIDQFPYASIIDHPLENFEPLFLSRGFPLSLFLEIHNTILKDISQKQIVDLVKEISKHTIITAEDLKKCNFSRFAFPQDDELKILFKAIIRQATRNKTELIQADKEFTLLDRRVSEQTKRVIRQKGNSISDIIEDKNRKPLLECSYRISEVLSEIEKTCLDYIWHLKDFYNKSCNLGKEIEANLSLKAITLKELKTILEEEIIHSSNKLTRLGEEFVKVLPFLEITQPKIEKAIVQKTLQLFGSTEKSGLKNREKIRESLLNLREEGRKKYKPHVNKLINGYKRVGNEVLLPLLTCGLLQRNIEEWTQMNKGKSVPESRLYDETNYFGLYAIPKGKFYHFSLKGKVRTKEEYSNDNIRSKLVDICLKHFKRTVTVLVYDIRGSSFMTLKLHNAEREQMIIKNFHSIMAKIAKEYGAFLLKDIGDGGIIWFGNNSTELYNSIYRESTTKKFKKLRHSLLSEEGLFLQSSFKSSEKALCCAISMANAAEKFIKDNYVKYRDWFADIKEKELIIEGTTYALLPPMFRSLFRLGIGIASGIPSRDVAIGPNAFGDPDLRGVLVNEAKFLSEGRDPENSVILADHNTVLNLLLATSKFTIGRRNYKIMNKDDMMSKVAEIVKEKLKDGILNFSDKNFTAEPYEILSLETFSRSKYSPGTFKLDENGILYNERGEKIKVLYLIEHNQ